MITNKTKTKRDVRTKATKNSKHYVYYLPKLDLLVPLTLAPPPIPIDCNDYFEMTCGTGGKPILLSNCVYYIGVL